MGYRSRNNNEAPKWFVLLIGMAMVFGVYYLYVGFREFLETGGSSVQGATEQAQEAATATLERRLALDAELPTRRPTSTSPPPCQPFIVIVDSAIMRSQPTRASQNLETVRRNSELCVQGSESVGQWTWYLIDRNPVTRRIEAGYMREDLLQAQNPTQTPLPTQQQARATVTPPVTNTPPPTATPQQQQQQQASATPTPTRPARPTRPPAASDTPVPAYSL
jgi:hypothetical protein